MTDHYHNTAIDASDIEIERALARVPVFEAVIDMDEGRLSHWHWLRCELRFWDNTKGDGIMVGYVWNDKIPEWKETNREVFHRQLAIIMFEAEEAFRKIGVTDPSFTEYAELEAAIIKNGTRAVEATGQRPGASA